MRHYPAAGAVVAALLALTPVAAIAQGAGTGGASFSGATGPVLSQVPSTNLAPPSGTLGPTLQTPFAPGAPQPLQSMPNVPAGQVPLTLNARYGRDMPAISNGLHWRIYANPPEQAGPPRLVKEDKGATPILSLPPGNYLVHVSFGLASTIKPVTVRAGEPLREVFDIAAGGLTIKGQVGDVRIPGGQISFDVYKGSQFDVGDRRPMVQSVMTGDVLLVPDGTYSIVSNYGDANSVVRSDIRVQSGKLTDVTVTHRAAVILLKLVGDRGGEALANTAWSVLTPGGDVIKESIGAFPRVVLAEGEYRAIARNDGKMFEREFKVITGVDGEVEVLAR